MVVFKCSSRTSHGFLGSRGVEWKKNIALPKQPASSIAKGSCSVDSRQSPHPGEYLEMKSGPAMHAEVALICL